MQQYAEVFPAYAGMSLLLDFTRGFIHGFPRIRGDEPADTVAQRLQPLFSPHTRG